MEEEYNFIDRAGRYMFFVFLIWGIIYILDRWIIRTGYLLNCCSLPIALIGAVVLEFIIGFVFEVN